MVAQVPDSFSWCTPHAVWLTLLQLCATDDHLALGDVDAVGERLVPEVGVDERWHGTQLHGQTKTLMQRDIILVHRDRFCYSEWKM